MDIKYYDRLLNIVGGGEVIEYIELLERENKSLAQEGEEKCEKLEQLNKKVLSLENENKQLNKTLDKACDELYEAHSACPYECFGVEGADCLENCQCESVKCWKEWCMHDE